MSLRVHKPYTLYDDGKHSFIWLGLDEAEAEKGILTNQYLVVDHGEGLLIDPGGYFVFERILDNTSKYVDPGSVKALFFSHQDPDVVGSLNLLLDMFPEAVVYVSSLWVRFLPHLGVLDTSRLREIPDNGGEITIGRAKLKIIPAHFLHSPGNFHLYDPVSKILFTGDLGAAVFPGDEWYLFVEDFEKHRKYMEAFHNRYLPCRKALDKWLEKIKDLDIQVIAPQHGAIMEKENATRFIEWLKTLDKIGIDQLQ